MGYKARNNGNSIGAQFQVWSIKRDIKQEMMATVTQFQLRSIKGMESKKNSYDGKRNTKNDEIKQI